MNLENSSIRRLVEELLSEAASVEKKGLCLAMCDKAGDLLLFVRTEKAAARGIPLAIAKAYTAALMECSTLELHRRLNREGLSLADLCDSRFTSMPGGMPIIFKNISLGGLGLCGCKPEKDHIWAESMARTLVEAMSMPLSFYNR